VVCGGAVCLASSLLLGPAAVSVGLSGAGLLLALLYPLVDLVLATVVLAQALLHQRQFNVRTAALSGGFLLLAVADSSFVVGSTAGTYASGIALDTRNAANPT